MRKSIRPGDLVRPHRSLTFTAWDGFHEDVYRLNNNLQRQHQITMHSVVRLGQARDEVMLVLANYHGAIMLWTKGNSGKERFAWTWERYLVRL
jgi:hypothetical protein